MSNAIGFLSTLRVLFAIEAVNHNSNTLLLFFKVFPKNVNHVFFSESLSLSQWLLNFFFDICSVVPLRCLCFVLHVCSRFDR